MSTFFRNKLFSIIVVFILVTGCAGDSSSTSNFVLLSTTMGDIKIKLYDQTPVHRDNFKKLVNSGFYDGILFHRVINNFMIQAGDASTRTHSYSYGADTISSYTLPAEINPELFHKKGAVAAARLGNDVNPEMRSSGTQFYIVQGTVLTDKELDAAEQIINRNLNPLLFQRLFKQIEDSNRIFGLNLTTSQIQERATIRMYELLSESSPYKIPDYQRDIYMTTGGVPRLDQTYTVFGEVVEGIDIVDKIASVKTDSRDRPVDEVKILHARVVKK